MEYPNIDDKDLIIGAALIIAVVALLQTTPDYALVQSIVTGLFGIAVGKNGK